MSLPPRIPVTGAQIDKVVARFYTRVRAHPQLGPVFAAHVNDWPAHEEKIGRFWRNALLFERSYDGNPMQIHKAAGNVRAAHFPIWLALFDEVLEQEVPGHIALAWSTLAHRIGRGLSYGLPPEEGASSVPDLRGLGAGMSPAAQTGQK
ncbi:globin family protein [Pelagivirga sediminicola]|uniref:Globin family protein n=1 Tax=Pelagivirga sediminicola TaxID=2170575 RepID=A0A2T7G8G1_9RHOB|nr:group III truncated hemoglobin [Pelagivirga sediminicola]PVA10687.1 globin family protein [Pelagivirga sediminicola]